MCGALALCSPMFVPVPGQWNLLPGAAVCIIDFLVKGGWAHLRDDRVKLHITNFTAGSKSHHLHCFNLSRLETKMMPFIWQQWWQWRQAGSHYRGKLYRKSLKYPGFSASFVCLCGFGMRTCVLQINMQAALLTWWVALVTMGLLSCNTLSWILICHFLERSIWVSSVKTGVSCFKIDVLVIIPAFTCAW